MFLGVVETLKRGVVLVLQGLTLMIVTILKIEVIVHGYDQGRKLSCTTAPTARVGGSSSSRAGLGLDIIKSRSRKSETGPILQAVGNDQKRLALEILELVGRAGVRL